MIRRLRQITLYQISQYFLLFIIVQLRILNFLEIFVAHHCAFDVSSKK